VGEQAPVLHADSRCGCCGGRVEVLLLLLALCPAFSRRRGRGGRGQQTGQLLMLLLGVIHSLHSALGLKLKVVAMMGV